MKKRIKQVCRQVCGPIRTFTPQMKRKIRIAYVSMIVISVIASAVIVAIAEVELRRIEEAARISAAPPFPVSVDPAQEEIVENPDVATYFVVHIEKRPKRTEELSWLGRTFERIAQSEWFQQLASPIARVLVIHPGERKEEIAEKFGDLLDWDENERTAFIESVQESHPLFTEGIYFPDRYLTHKDASPAEVAAMVTTGFDEEVLVRYPDEVAAQVPLQKALIIASLLEREAYDFTDMREIAGIIWNRLFIDMNLQLDATLQYAKANEAEGGPWWPRAVPDDKYIDSPYNTYEHAGLPPAPISNPSLDAILAALNPIETDCMFYFHDSNSKFHCSETYEGHVELLRQYYGQGR